MDRAKAADTEWSKTAAGSDFLQLDIRAAPTGRMAAWLADALRAAIADGRLPIGARLPATRTLAADLAVSRGVVTEAYQQLIEDGTAAGRGRAGTVVRTAPVAPPVRSTGTGRSGSVFTDEPDVRVFDALRAEPARIDFSPGVPDLTAFPRTAWLRAERLVLQQLSPQQFGYGDPRGTPTLRAAVAEWLARNRGIRVDPAEVIIVCGVSQSLALLAQVLRGHGHTEIHIEDPSSLGTRQHLRNWGLHTPPVRVDDGGLVVDELGAAQTVLVTPAHQFPTGVVLDGERRGALLRWASAGGLIIEDDYDAEHRYDRAPVPALRAKHAEGVCYAGSVSKLLAPAVRVGWLLVPSRLREAVVDAKRDADLGNAVLPQLVLARLMSGGDLERQLRMLRVRHRKRRDAMIGAIRRYLPGAVVHGAAAGLHLTVTFQQSLPDVAFAADALASGVKVQPLSWHRQGDGPPGLVLGYAARSAGEIDAGVAVLGDLLRARR